MAKNTLDKLEEQKQNATKRTRELKDQVDALLASLGESETKNDKLEKIAAKWADLQEMQKDHTRKERRAAIDLTGGFASWGFDFGYKLLTWWMRNKGWVGEKRYPLLFLPQWLLGILVYIAELLTRPNGQLPSWGREFASESSKIFAQLGLNNLSTLMLERWYTGRTKSKETAARAEALAAENATLRDALKKASGK